MRTVIGTRYGDRRRFTTLDAVFGGVGFVAGLAGAIYSYALFPSVALALFVFAMVSYVLGRALPDVITEARKAQRIAYFALLPAVGSLTLYASYLLSERMWPAVLLGFIAGAVAQLVVGKSVLPEVRKEETEEELERAGIWPEEWGEPGPEDLGWRWRKRLHAHGGQGSRSWERFHGAGEGNRREARSGRRALSLVETCPCPRPAEPGVLRKG